MNAAIMISIETGGAIGSDIIQCSAHDAVALQQALATCQGLVPGEVAQRLAGVFAAFQSAKVTHIDTGEIFPTELPPPPDQVDMTPPADDPPPPIPLRPRKAAKR
jgi:hypothetical protein